MILMNIKNVFNRVRLINNKNKVRYINTSAINLKIFKCKLYDVGEGISEVEVTSWNKNEGDKVYEMEQLLTVQSDKAAVDITSKYTGIIVKKYVKEKDIVKIGSDLCDVDVEEGDAPEGYESSKIKEENQETDESGNEDALEIDLNAEQSDKFVLDEPSNDSNTKIFEREKKQALSIKASPGAKKKAIEYNLDISKISEYFNKENITLNDVENYYKNKKNVREKTDDNYMDVGEEVLLTGIKLAMCKSMNDSLRVPLFHLNEVCILKELLKIKSIFSSLNKKENLNITITGILIKLISIALNDFPILNSKYDAKKNSYVTYKNHNICIAMDTPHGLIVPNIKNVQEKNVVEIQKDLVELHKKASELKLSKTDITNGTFTISNFGSIGGSSFATPIVFDNQACIVGISKASKQLVLKDNKKELNSINDIEVLDTLNITYGADHRYIDGATLARFSERVKAIVENPISIIPFLK